jgi:hypothetical protein
MRWQVTGYYRQNDVPTHVFSGQRQSIKHDRTQGGVGMAQPHATARHLDRIL